MPPATFYFPGATGKAEKLMYLYSPELIEQVWKAISKLMEEQ